jgi:hypothetical protein
MRWLRNAEMISGLLTLVVGLVSIAVAVFVPWGEASQRLYSDGKLIETRTYATSLTQHIGLELEIGILMSIGVLVLWVVVAATLHARSGRGEGLGTVWGAVVLLAAASYVSTGLLLAPLFWPTALMALLCAVFATMRHLPLPLRPAA